MSKPEAGELLYLQIPVVILPPNVPVDWQEQVLNVARSYIQSVIFPALGITSLDAEYYDCEPTVHTHYGDLEQGGPCEMCKNGLSKDGNGPTILVPAHAYI